MSAEQAEAEPDVQQKDGAADAGIVLGGEETSEVDTSQQDADTEQTDPTDADAADGQGEGEPAVPESYELAAPDGVTVPDAVVAAASESFKTNKLTQEQAAGVYKDLVQAHTANMQERFAEQKRAWADEVRNDPVLGGENLQGTILKANQALKAFDKDGSFLQLLNDSGLSSTKAGLAFLAAVTDATADDDVVVGTNGEQAPRSAKSHFQNSPQLND